MLSYSSFPQQLELSPGIHGLQRPVDSLLVNRKWIKPLPNLHSDKISADRKTVPNKLYTKKMKYLLKSKKLTEAKDLYLATVNRREEAGIILGSVLIDMLMKSAFVSEAFLVFEAMREKNVITWTSMILGCVHNYFEEDGLYMFIDMLESGVAPNEYSFNATLLACNGLRSISLGEQIHSLIIRSGFGSNCRIGSCLIDFYSKCGLMDNASQVFKSILELNLVSYTSMISGFCRNNCYNSAVELFTEMVKLGLEPNEYTISSILTACGLLLGKQIHCYMIKSMIDHSVFSASSLIEFYSRNYKFEQANLVFKKSRNRSVVTWSSMISCFIRDDRVKDAFRLFVEMISEGIEPNEFTLTTLISDCKAINLGCQLHAYVIKLNMVTNNRISNALLSMYAHIGEMLELDKVWQKNEHPDVVSWSSAISGYFHNGFYERSARLLCEMHSKDLKPNEYGLSSALGSCANLTLVDQGRQLHCLALKLGCDIDVCLGNALIHLYAKCGYLSDARLAFDFMPFHDIMSWNSLIHGYANHGFGCEAFKLFEEIVDSESCVPNHSTFLGILVGCNHNGFIDEAIKYLKIMEESHGLVPHASHYTCMVDMMGRAGKLVDALNIIDQMPYKPDILIWKSFLGSCKLHKDLDLGKLAAERAIEMSPEDSASYVILSNLHAMHGEWEYVEKLRMQMEDKGVKKDSGCSWIQIRNEVSAFLASDWSHSKAETIYQILDELFGIIKDDGGADFMNYDLCY